MPKYGGTTTIGNLALNITALSIMSNKNVALVVTICLVSE